jgi:uncharacterized membrane protein
VPLDDSSAEASAWLADPGEVALPDPDRLAPDPADLAPDPKRPAHHRDDLPLDTEDLVPDPKRPAHHRDDPANRGEGQPDREPARGTGLLDPVTVVIAASVTAAYCVVSVFRYLRLDPTSWDLGIFTEYIKQYANLRAPVVDIKSAGFNLLGDHFHPIVALVAPFFRLFPSPVTLLVVQALLVGVSVLPVSQLGRELLGPAAGRCVAAAFGLSWGLQQLAKYDFHEIAFAVSLLAFSLSAMVRGRTRAAVLWALPLVFVKEDQGFTLVAIGLIMAFAYRRYGAGLLLSCWGLFWSLLAITVIIPHFSPQHSYQYWTDAGAFNPTGGHLSVSGLWSTLSDGASTKLPTLAMILLPTAFIALRSPVVLAALPSLLERAVDTNSAYWGTAWHYNATVMPIVFVAAIDAMARIHAQRQPAGRLAMAAYRYGAAAMVAISAALAFQFPLSDLWTPATYTLGPHVTAANRAMALVPDGATVSTDLNLLAPLAARTDTFWLGTAGADPATQYVVFDTQSTDCTAWEAVCAEDEPSAVLHQVESLEHGARYQQIFASDGVFVLRRLAG